MRRTDTSIGPLIPDSQATVTPARTATWFTQSFVGGRRNDLIGKEWFESCVPESYRAQGRGLFQEILSGARHQMPHEGEVMTRHGERRLVSWNESPLFDPEERVIGLTCIGEDITEARAAEHELRKLSQAVEQSPSVVMIVDTRGRIEYVNPKFTRLTGFTLEEVKGKNPRVLKSGETSSTEYANLWKTVSEGGEWRGVFHNRKKDGELYWETASISAIKNAEGKITHYLAVKEDIPERKRLEQEVEAGNREIVKTQSLTAMGRTASMIAHDLRNPLSSIKMTLQILGDRAVADWQDEEQELKQIALEQVRYMEEILADLLSYSRPDALKPEWLSIDKLLDTAIILAQKQIRDCQAHVSTWYQTGLPTLHGDVGKLRQVFSNMVVNAVQAAEGVADRRPEVTVSAHLDLGEDRPRVRVEICDNGGGIDPEQADRLFEPFFTTRARGTGLGLAIVKRIIDQHHGTVHLEPRVQGGTCAITILATGPIEDTQPNKTRHDQSPEPIPESAPLDTPPSRRQTSIKL